MDSSPIPTISVATLILVVINLIVAAFSYGKLSQQVQETCRRVEALEKWKEHKGEKDE